MKRSEHLEPLSDDRYEGLLVAGRIKKGLAREAPFRVMADYVAAFWRSHLSRHFEQEETHLLSLIDATPRADFGRRMVDQHREIRAVKEGIDEAPSGPPSSSSRARRSASGLKFRDIQYVVQCNGFRLDRIKGSHHIYVHPTGARLNVQARPDGDAKAYQVKQALKAIDRIRENE